MSERRINAERLKDVIDLFTRLNAERQAKVFAYLYTEFMEQKAEMEFHEAGEQVSAEMIAETANKNISEIMNIVDIIGKLDDTGKAAMLMMLEKISPGTVTKEEEITVTINNKRISLEAAIKQFFPDMDMNSVRNKIDMLKASK